MPPTHQPTGHRSWAERRRESDGRRGSAASRGYGHKWRKARERFLNENPLCKRCLEADVIEAATVVDHIVPHRGDRELFWDETNWQALCKAHHDYKTATEDMPPPRKASA